MKETIQTMDIQEEDIETPVDIKDEIDTVEAIEEVIEEVTTDSDDATLNNAENVTHETLRKIYEALASQQEEIKAVKNFIEEIKTKIEARKAGITGFFEPVKKGETNEPITYDNIFKIQRK